MKNKKYLGLLIVLAILISSIFSIYGADSNTDENNKTVMELRLGSSFAAVNGVNSPTGDAPYVSDSIVMIPLEWFADTIGAEVNKTSANMINIIYCGNTEEITIGKTGYIANSEKKTMSAAPVAGNSSTMVPMDFITSNFPVTVSNGTYSGSIKIVLEDDGALSDLSFLTGGISAPKIGNSYYGWSLSIPAGSRLISNSYKSDKIAVTNEAKGLYFEVSVENKNRRTLSDVYEDLKSNGVIQTLKLDLKAGIPYFEYVKISDYGEFLRVKVFDKGDYFYFLTINCYDRSVSTEQLVKGKYYTDIINSFDLNYRGNVKGIEEMSKVVNGHVSFYNYVYLSSETKYLPWSMEIPVKWSQILTGSERLTTYLGLDSKHYMQVTVNPLGELSLDEYVESIKDGYYANFSPKAYSFISAEEKKIAGTEAKNLKFSIKQAGKKFIIDEYYFQKGGLVYEVSVKLPEKEYSQGKADYINTVNSMSFYEEKEDDFLSDIEKYKSLYADMRLAQDDTPFNYVNKAYKWSAKIPGYWTNTSYFDSEEEFNNPDTNASVSVECSPILTQIPDEERFDGMKQLQDTAGCKLISKTVTSEKGTKVRNYKYQIQNEENDIYGVSLIHIFEYGKYSYCYMSFMPDLTATDKAVKEVDDIWKSFKVTK
jgi:hypothetical protein